MLKRFEVQVYDNGELIRNLVLDLTANEDKYDWNKNLVENGIVKKALFVLDEDEFNKCCELVNEGIYIYMIGAKRCNRIAYDETKHYRIFFNVGEETKEVFFDVVNGKRLVGEGEKVEEERALLENFSFNDLVFFKFSYKSAVEFVKETNTREKTQEIIFTNQIALMDNELTRPDCCFLVKKNEIKALDKCTDKEIRKEHNLEAMYKNGVFD